MRGPFADRYRLPKWVNAGIDFIADNPMSPLGRLAAMRMGRPAAGTFPTSQFPDARVRLLIAPVNYSGQGREWARAVEQRDPTIAARNMAIEVAGGFSFQSDLLVPVAVYNNDRGWQRRQFESVASHATHLLVEAEEPPFGRLMHRDTVSQAMALRARGVSTAFMAHGTDIRLPSRHRELTKWSLYHDRTVYSPRLETLARRNLEIIRRVGGPVFVSTPDLLADVDEGAQWCPVVVDLTRWRSPDEAPEHSDALRVVHAPSVANHKGTPLIASTLERLHAEGIIQYQVVAGIPSAQMPPVYHQADVLLDQFRAGSYGVAACEAMAAGCAVVGHVVEGVREVVQEIADQSLPIVEATPDTIERVIRDLAGDRGRLARVKRDSLTFAGKVHDGRLSATVLIENWLAG
jgi:hypothetical protein